MKKLLKWGVIGIVVLAIIGALSGGSDNNSSTKSNQTGQQAQRQETTYKIGEKVTSKNLEMTVTTVGEKASVGTQYFMEKPSEGGTLVVVQWQYKNISSEPVGSFSQPTIKLVDSSGVEYSNDGGKTSAYATEIKLDTKILSDLNPGITVKDADVFEISKEAYTKGGWSVLIKADGKSYKISL
ncbi:DUF4352 domain-containing protein [Candidatus Woesebacteria bacterium]|nr:DUF4352 domain-containing protein [Candidatus Woesebacteria bacterium]